MSSLLDDIKDRDAQTEPITDPQYLPLGQSGTKYDHARRLRNNYHLDDYTLAMGDRHFLLEMVRDLTRASSGESGSPLLERDDSDIKVVPDEQRSAWLTEEQKRQPGIPDFSKVKRSGSPGEPE